MRTTKTAKGITVKAYAGTTGVLLALNVTDAKRAGLLGFSLERKHSRPKWHHQLAPAAFGMGTLTTREGAAGVDSFLTMRTAIASTRSVIVENSLRNSSSVR